MPADPLEGILDGFRLFAQIQAARDRQQSLALREEELQASKRFRQDQQLERSKSEQRAASKQTAGLLGSGAVPLNPTEQGFLRQQEAGQLGGARLHIPLTEGVSAAAAGRTVASGGSELFIPSDDDAARRDLAQRLEQETASFRVKNPQLSPQLADDLGLPSTTRVPPSSISTLVSTRDRKKSRSEPESLTFHTFDNDKGQRIRVGFDQQGREMNRTVVGKTAKRSLAKKKAPKAPKEISKTTFLSQMRLLKSERQALEQSIISAERVAQTGIVTDEFGEPIERESSFFGEGEPKKMTPEKQATLQRKLAAMKRRLAEINHQIGQTEEGTGLASPATFEASTVPTSIDDIGTVEASDFLPLSEAAQRFLQQVQ